MAIFPVMDAIGKSYRLAVLLLFFAIANASANGGPISLVRGAPVPFVRGEPVPLLQAPVDTSPVLARLSPYTAVKVFETSGAWVRVQVPDSMAAGWTPRDSILISEGVGTAEPDPYLFVWRK
jgi:hypothetical protein